jgi:hypothetical protein
MSSGGYANLVPQALAGNLQLPGHATKMGLLGVGYTANFTAHIHWADVSAYEITGTGYGSGGVTLASATLTLVAANSWSAVRTAATVYAYGAVVRPSAANGLLYMAAVAGTTGAGTPTFPVNPGQTVVDGGVTWCCIGGWATVYTTAPAYWASTTITARYGVVYDSVSNVLVCLQDFGTTLTTAGQPFQVAPDPVAGWAVFPPL